MRRGFTAWGPLVLALFVFALPLHAQTAASTTKTFAHYTGYDVRQEVSISGAVSSVVKTPARGTEVMPGSHLIVATSAGEVDASLGKYALAGKSPLSVKPGQQVQMLGVMRTVGERQVFVVRVVQVDGHSYALRNAHGFADPSIARGGAPKSQTKGGQL
jgi:hypothetical protein